MDLPQVPNDPNACWIEIPEMNDGHFAQLRETIASGPTRP
jgi:hypothetical protein